MHEKQDLLFLERPTDIYLSSERELDQTSCVNVKEMLISILMKKIISRFFPFSIRGPTMNDVTLPLMINDTNM
jgi:hypothetical protein